MVTRSILRPVLRPVTRAVSDTIRGFNPRSLFASGEQGIWLDPSDFSTLFQDAAGTTPVTAVGQPVGKILDKSGRGNHATQSTGASRPTLQQDSNGLYYLSFDGTDDGMATPSINFTGTDKMTVWAGVRKLSDAAAAAFVELSANANTNSGAFVLFTPLSGGNIVMRHRGSSAFIEATGTPYAAPVTAVVSASSALGTGAVAVNVNKTPFTSTGVTGGGNYGNYPLYIGRRNNTSLPFNGRIYQLIVRGAESNAGQIAAGEAWCNAKTRAF
jgi:ribosomal protein S11